MKITYSLVYDTDDLTCLEDGSPDGSYTKSEKAKIEQFLIDKCIKGEIESELFEELSNVIYSKYERIHRLILADRQKACEKGLHFEYKGVEDIMDDYELTFAEACEVVHRILNNSGVQDTINDVLIDAIQDIAIDVKRENEND